jgi:hypothetical protein
VSECWEVNKKTVSVSTKQANLANGNSVLIDIPNFSIAYKY